ncbi:MAG: GGDEF domain-containing phosphodiesterase [Longicatena sp.]
MVHIADEQLFIEQYHNINESDREHYALITLKIKRFRKVNRLFGRDVGDELLTLIYQILKNEMKDNEVVSMLGINYYNLLLRYDSDEELIDRMINLVRCTRDNGDSRFHNKVFCGLGGYRLKKEKEDFYTAQYNADLCRCESEHYSFRNGYIEIYGLTYKDPNENFLDPQHKIANAIAKGHIKLFLQPKVNLKNGSITSAEALVRWIDPEIGEIPVASFLPSLNDTGLIRNVDLYLFEEVCKAIQKWIALYHKEIVISVNLAKCSFDYKDFFEDYQEIFERYDIPKHCIQFELLENIILNQLDRLQDVVDELNAYGFTCALDDFGSGFSSYNVITHANLAVLKIDRSLFQDVDNEKEKVFIKHVIYSAKELHMKTVAEGVENEGYVNYLRNIGCDYIQGFVFYRPMSVEDFGFRFVKNNEKVKFQ